MADSSLNEPPVKKPRVDSPPKDSTVIEINDEVDNTTKNDSTVIEINDEVDNTTKNDSTVIEINDEVDNTTKNDSTVIEINDEVDNTTKNDTDPKSGSSNQLDDSDPKGENDKSIPIIDLLSDSEMDSDKPLDVDCSEVAKIQPAAGDKKNDGKNDAKKPEDVFDDNDVGSSDEEDEGVKSKKEVPLEAFNMEEEKEMGSFDEDFNFQWKTKSREPTDAWLASEGSTPLDREIEPPVPESSSGSNGEEKTESNKPTIEELKNHLSFVQYYMKGDETVRVAVSRMSNPLAASASARLALKKAGGSYKVAPTSQEATSLHTFLGKVTSFPVKADIYNLKQSEIQSIIADHDKLFAFREQAYGSNPIEITSDDDSDEEVEEVPSKKDKKRSIMMYVSSSDDDDVEEVKDQGKPAGANGGGLDMFAQ